MSQAGVDDRIIDHFMGHVTKEMRRRCQHLLKERARQRASEVPAESDVRITARHQEAA